VGTIDDDRPDLRAAAGGNLLRVQTIYGVRIDPGRGQGLRGGIGR